MSRWCARWFDGWMLALGTCALAVHCEHMCIVRWLGAHVDHLCSVQQVLGQMVGMGTVGTLGREKRGGCQSARVPDTCALVIFFLFNQNQALSYVGIGTSLPYLSGSSRVFSFACRVIHRFVHIGR